MKESNKSLISGLTVIIFVVVLVALVGMFAIRPQEELVMGEADATEYRVRNKVPGRIDAL